MFVSVVIDLKAREIDQLYDYYVPEEFVNLIQIGTRVVISFGNMQRIGYVIEILDESQAATKPILDVLDPTPLLDKELMLIYNYLTEHTTSLKSAILEAIIPSEFMHHYQKKITLLKEFDDELINRFNKNNEWILKTSDQKYYRKLRQLEESGFIHIKTILAPRVKPKVAIGYRFNEKHTYQRIGNYNHIASLFLENELILRSDLLEVTNAGVINTLERNKVIFREDVIIKRTIAHQFEKEKYDITLNKEQASALDELKKGLNKASEYLLFGVTGSGKTEVYVNLIDEVIKTGSKVLVLVPEINMISQVAKRLKSSYDNVAIIHSALSPGEKHDEYQKIYEGEANIILGTRSAIFAPIDKLGLIVLDEEQDESYLQTEQVIYDTSLIAKIRSNYHKCPILYVSATPRVTRMYQAKQNQIKLLELTEQAVQTTPIEIKFVDLKEELKSGHTSIISRELIKEIEIRLKNNEQIIILVNRRGFAPIAMCRICGYIPICPNCQISLTYYHEDSELKCHYCGYNEEFSIECPKCLSQAISPRGIAIEFVIRELRKLFKNAKIIQMDYSTTTRKGSHEKLWYQFLKKDGDILVGTQMVAKGFDFPDVTLSAVILADHDLKIASYNADEKTYILLKQLIGRSGRHKPGLAIIQGYHLNHYAIESLKEDYLYFYKKALENRQLANYPPYKEMGQVIVSGPGYLATYQQAFIIKEKLEDINVNVLGPTQALILKRANQYRFKLTLKHENKDLKDIVKIIKEKNTNEIRAVFTPFIDLE